MQDYKENLANAIRQARTEHGLSQEKLAEALGFSSRTILDAESGRGNPKFDKLYQIVTYLKVPADRIFYPDDGSSHPNLQKLLMELSDCSEDEAKELFPAVRYLLELMRK